MDWDNVFNKAGRKNTKWRMIYCVCTGKFKEEGPHGRGNGGEKEQSWMLVCATGQSLIWISESKTGTQFYLTSWMISDFVPEGKEPCMEVRMIHSYLWNNNCFNF